MKDAINPTGVFVPVTEVFPGLESNFKNFVKILRTLSRTDTLFWCARLNNVVSSSSENDHVSRQQFGLSQFLTPEEIENVNSFVKKMGGPHNVTIFFRGQILELFRWVTLFCNDHPEDGTTFRNQEIRRSFAQAALIASEVWARRVFGDRFSLNGGLTLARERALGTIRKSIEASSSAPDLPKTLGRGWAFFTEYFPRFYPSFERDFKLSFGLSLEQYYICICSIITSFMSPYAEEQGTGIFDANSLGEATPYREILAHYLHRESQTPDEIKRSIWGKVSTGIGSFEDIPPYDYRFFREKPILRVHDGRAIIIDPFFYSEKASVGPFFHILKGSDSRKSNEIFGAFGNAFESYASDFLSRIFPEIPSLELQRLNCNMKIPKIGQRRDTLEIDACLNDFTEIVLFEMKAVWLREDEILSNDHEVFLEHLRKKYGIPLEDSSSQREKGVGQLARLVRLVANEQFKNVCQELASAEVVYPVLLVHDPFIGAPVYGNFLASEFKKHLDPDLELQPDKYKKGKLQIAPLIVMTIEDLENLETSLEHFGLRELLNDYSQACVDRLVSLHNYIATSNYAKKIYHSRWLAGKLKDIAEKTMVAVFQKRISEDSLLAARDGVLKSHRP